MKKARRKRKKRARPKPRPENTRRLRLLLPNPASPPKVGADSDGGLSLKEADTVPQPATNPPPTKEKTNPWNAVYTIGLRVYAKDADVTIKLIKLKGDEEAAALDVNGATPAGVTM